jgi:hypothetical protein
MPDITITTIEQSCKSYADKRDTLSSIVTLLNAQLEALKNAALPDIKKAVAKAAEKESDLKNAIDGARHLFIKPRTIIMHGIKIGLRKGSGGIDWEDDAKVVSLIEKLFPKAQAELLIKTTKKPISKALSDLDVSDLKRIGCTIESTGDVIVINPVDSAVDKIVTALLKGASEEPSQPSA